MFQPKSPMLLFPRILSSHHCPTSYFQLIGHWLFYGQVLWEDFSIGRNLNYPTDISSQNDAFHSKDGPLTSVNLGETIPHGRTCGIKQHTVTQNWDRSGFEGRRTGPGLCAGDLTLTYLHSCGVAFRAHLSPAHRTSVQVLWCFSIWNISQYRVKLL